MKQKSHSGLKKRVKVTSTGKMIVGKSAKRHLLLNKSKKAKGRGKYGVVLCKSDAKKIACRIQA